MARIKDKRKEKVCVDHEDEDKILFSFRYMTSKKEYSFDYFKKNKGEKIAVYEAFYEKMKKLSDLTMQECIERGKISGCEAIPFASFSEGFKSILNEIEIVSNDSQLAVFRFYKNDYRLVCKRGITNKNVLYVIGYDFNYTAYGH